MSSNNGGFRGFLVLAVVVGLVSWQAHREREKQKQLENLRRMQELSDQLQKSLDGLKGLDFSKPLFPKDLPKPGDMGKSKLPEPLQGLGTPAAPLGGPQVLPLDSPLLGKPLPREGQGAERR